MPQPITPQYLLHGAAYALEQCGLLLRDANILYRSKSHSSAVVMAAFAQEELGRWKMLLSLRQEAIGGKQLTVDDVAARCGDHVSRQRAGMLSTTIRGDRSVVMGVANAVPGTSEWEAAHQEVDRLVSKLRKRTPGERHERRMSALYVDPVSPTEWNRPSARITQEDARRSLTDAGNDYSIQCERYSKLEILKVIDPELADALAQWPDRPQMLPPEWPAHE
jgi:AbiV family abortive infection protein